MTIIFVLIPLGLVLLGVAVWAFFWAVSNGQFDDLDSPAYRILMDDDKQPQDDADTETDQTPR
jgi:cbb3-type cytochrome oxidase maturation protein